MTEHTEGKRPDVFDILIEDIEAKPFMGMEKNLNNPKPPANEQDICNEPKDTI